jgi:hypothetical protein
VVLGAVDDVGDGLALMDAEHPRARRPGGGAVMADVYTGPVAR